ncbi:MAG: hypothetical protein CSA38_02770 [Flavobacteriales bacterium]|nr:MAG: hypothetical protein CSA38_02770 [Flavobacteriales bacterium]
MKINIPQPCHENWNEMTPKEKGRFCKVCQKTVRDFSNDADEELFDFFSENTEEVCGNFNQSQLNRDLRFSYLNSLLAKFAIGLTLTASGWVSVKAQQKECQIKNDSTKVLKNITIPNSRLVGKVVPRRIIPKKDTIQEEKERKLKEKTVIVGGVGTVTSTQEPLYILDKKVISAQKLKQLDHKKIKNIVVLKDEKAVAIYGEKGRYGVVIITSKK